jgi:antitoxin MazE
LSLDRRIPSGEGVSSSSLAQEDAVRVRIRKWGDELGLRIPDSLAKEAGIKAGSQVDLTVEGGDLVVRPRCKPRYALSDLLSQVCEDNLHREIDTGDAAGKEAC